MRQQNMKQPEAAKEIVVVCRLIMATTGTCRWQIERFLAYFVDGEGEEPPRAAYPDRALNPKLNGTSALLKRLREALGCFMPGTLPGGCLGAFSDMINDAMAFVESLQGFARTKSLEVSLTTEADVFGYMTQRPIYPISRKKHLANLKGKFKEMKQSFFANSAFYSNITTQILNESTMPRQRTYTRTFQDTLAKLRSKSDVRRSEPLPVVIVGGWPAADTGCSCRRAVSVAQLVALLDERCERERLGDKKRTAKTFVRWEHGKSEPIAGYSAACRDSLPAALAWIDGYIIHCRAAVASERAFVSFNENCHVG